MTEMEKAMAAVEAAAAAKTGASVGETEKGAENGAETERIMGNLDANQLIEMKLDKLKGLAKDMGLDVKRCKTKAEIAELIAKEEVTVTADCEAEDDGLEKENEGEDRGQGEENSEEPADGEILVTYAGMVNLRDMDGNVDGFAMQGQTFRTAAKVKKFGREWYKVGDNRGKTKLIDSSLVRLME